MTSIVVLSGGLDSTCALAVTPDVVKAVSFDYGQRHRKELTSAALIAAHYGIAHQVIRLDLLHGSALVDPSTVVPEGRYDAPSMSATVVPGRNLVFAAAAIAAAEPGQSVVFGVHAGDHPIYPDCRPEFWGAVADAAMLGYDVGIATPFIESSKAEALRAGHNAGAPVELTWSCYKGGTAHCGRCGTCVERAEAFDLAGVSDPTVYQDADYWRKVTA